MDVIVTNPEMSAGQKVGIVLSFIIGAFVFYLIYKLGAPKQ